MSVVDWGTSLQQGCTWESEQFLSARSLRAALGRCPRGTAGRCHLRYSRARCVECVCVHESER
eukprot:6842078-Alexandrium_andersonii.AAC.1